MVSFGNTNFVVLHSQWLAPLIYKSLDANSRLGPERYSSLVEFADLLIVEYLYVAKLRLDCANEGL